MDYYLKCASCKSRFQSDYSKQTCGKCGAILEVIYKGTMSVPRCKGFWDYEKLMPKGRYTHYAIGGTELVHGKERGNLFLKLELNNPTGSFKDRGSVIEISKAVEYGYDEIAVASTGNMAYSLAYYAKKSGIKASVFIGGAANPDKLKDILETHDAVVHKVKGDFTMAQALATKYAAKSGAFLSGDYCYRKEGQKTIAYEIAAQLEDVTHMIVPVGNATLISGIAKALKEMKRKDIKIIAVQAERCSPLVKAFMSGRAIKYERPMTLADAIAVGMPTYGGEAIAGIKASGGTAITVTEKEMEEAQGSLYEGNGITAELAGAASMAAYTKLRFKSGDKVAAIISGGNV